MILGKHTLMDVYDVNSSTIDDLELMKKIILDSCKEAGLHVVNTKFRKFEPVGLSGVCILKESHLAIHTWPEFNFACIDAFTCGSMMNPSLVCQIIARKLNSSKFLIKELDRGVINE